MSRLFVVMLTMLCVCLSGCTRGVEVPAASIENPLMNVETALPKVFVNQKTFASMQDVQAAYAKELTNAATFSPLAFGMFDQPQLRRMVYRRLNNGYMLTGYSPLNDKVWFMHTKLNRTGRKCSRGFTVGASTALPLNTVKSLFFVVICMTGTDHANVVWTNLGLDEEFFPNGRREYLDRRSGVLYVLTCDRDFQTISFLIDNCPDGAE